MHSPCLRVHRRQGEPLRRRLRELGLLRLDLAPIPDGEWLLLPVAEGRADEAAGLGFPLEAADFREVPRPVSPRGLLGFPPAYEMVGDIAVAAAGSPREVGEALLRAHPHLRTVLAPLSSVEGEFRTRRFEVLAGEDRRVTLHRENGLRLRVDLEAAYFSPRLATERLRVARHVGADEAVVDMFAGVGPFALLLARRARRVYAADLNPRAVELLRENAALNRRDNVVPVVADAAVLELPEPCQRAVMNLPHGAAAFLPSAVRLLAGRGMIHFYGIGPEASPYAEGEAAAARTARLLGVEIAVVGRRVVHSYAPRVQLVALDLAVGSDESGEEGLQGRGKSPARGEHL